MRRLSAAVSKLKENHIARTRELKGRMIDRAGVVGEGMRALGAMMRRCFKGSPHEGIKVDIL